jgi:hypothetical protein
MTLPGKMLTESVARLGDTIKASKQVSDALKAATVPTPVTPVPVGEVAANEPASTGNQAQG